MYIFLGNFKCAGLPHLIQDQPRDIFREFRAYVTSFDSKDDDNSDGKPDRWGAPHWVAYEIKRFEGTLGKGPNRPSSPGRLSEFQLVGVGLS